MLEKIEESVTVAAVFSYNSPIRPVWFVWRNRRYRILKVTYSWMAREGSEKRYHFAVSDGSNLYELCYESERLSWRLIAVDIEG